MTKKVLTTRIPDFKSRQEEAEFWDTHSIADYRDELPPIRVKFVKTCHN